MQNMENTFLFPSRPKSPQRLIPTKVESIVLACPRTEHTATLCSTAGRTTAPSPEELH